MNIRHLRYFIEIAATGNLRRASQVLYVSQSALSRAAAELEDELECELLERSQRGVVVTPAGLRLRNAAQRILGEVDSLRAELKAEQRGLKNQPAGHVRLAMPVGVRDRITRPLVHKLRSEYPNIRVDIADGNAHENRAAVLDGTADIAVLHEMERGLPISYRRLYVDALCLVGPRKAGFSLKKPLPVSALADRPLLQTRPPNQIRWSVDAALRELGSSGPPTMEVSSSVVLLDLVEDGHGYTVLPESIVAEAVQSRALSAGRLGTLKVTWIVAWPKGKTLSRSARAALDALIAVAS